LPVLAVATSRADPPANTLKLQDQPVMRRSCRCHVSRVSVPDLRGSGRAESGAQPQQGQPPPLPGFGRLAGLGAFT
jgi:hypothetical protein